MTDTTTKDNAAKLAAICEQANADFEQYEAATKQLAGNSMLSDSGRKATQDKLDASWHEQRSKLLSDALAVVDEIYTSERNAEIGFLINPSVTEAVAIIDKLADVLDARAIRELGVRFLGEQAPLHCLAEYMLKKGVPEQRIDSALDGMIYSPSLPLEMADALNKARIHNAGGRIDCMSADGAVAIGAAKIMGSFEKPEQVAGTASRTVRTMF